MPANEISELKLAKLILHESQKTISQIQKEQQEKKIILEQTQIQNEKLIEEFHQLNADRERLQNQIVIVAEEKKQVEEERSQQNDPSATIRSHRALDQQLRQAELRNQEEREKLHQKMLDQIQSYQQSIDVCQDKITQINNEKRQLNLEATKLKQISDGREDKLKKLKQEIDQSKKESNEKSSDTSNLCAEIVGEGVIIDAQERRIEKLEEKIARLQHEMKRDHMSIKEAKNMVKKLERAEKALKQKEEELIKSRDRQIAAIDSLNTQLSSPKRSNSRTRLHRSTTDLPPGEISVLKNPRRDQQTKKRQDPSQTTKEEESRNVRPTFR